MQSRAIKSIVLLAFLLFPQRVWSTEARFPVMDSCHGQIQIVESDPRGTILVEYIDSPGVLPDACTIQTPKSAWAKVTLAHSQCVALVCPNSVLELSEQENRLLVKKGSAVITVRENSGPGVKLQTKKHVIDLRGGTVKIVASEADSILRLVGRSTCIITNRSTGKTSKLLIGSLFESK
jgi:hypothetical protein